jgi:hypothetical protein
LNDDSEWHCLLPWEKFEDIAGLLASWLTKTPNALIPFPSFEKEDYGLDLKRILFHPITFALIYYSLSEFLAKTSLFIEIHLQYTLNLLLHTSKLQEGEYIESSIEINAENFPELCQRLIGLDFRSFVLQKITFCHRPPQSVYDLLLLLKNLGRYVLTRIGFDVPEPDASECLSVKRGINSLKKRILAEFAARQHLLRGSEPCPKQSDPLNCSICMTHTDTTFLGYPVLKFHSVLYSIVKQRLFGTTKIIRSLALRICLHSVHAKCINSTAFTCPLDRGFRNAILPIWSGAFTKPPDQIIEAMTHFCGEVFNSFEVAINTLANHISLMEVRLRSSPYALDDVRFLTLIHHFYFAIVHGYTSPTNISHKFPLVIVQSLSGISLHDIVSVMVHTINTPTRQYIFLRRCAILEECLSDSFHTGQDWESFMSWEALCDHFKVSVTDQPNLLPPFTFCELPDQFLGFFTPPRSISRKETDKSLLSLLTGDIVVMSRPPRSGELSLQGLMKKICGTYTPLLVLSGEHSNATMYWSSEWDQQYREALEPLYVDRFGDPDIGFRRGRALKLSQDAVDRQLDRLLSHAWTDEIV